MTDRTVDLAAELSDLWSDEGCGWEVRFNDGGGLVYAWTVTLLWTQDGMFGGTPHDATWATYRWEFDGWTLTAALSAAAVWCRSLLPYEVCHACDGIASPSGCPECDATGLAHPEMSR